MVLSTAAYSAGTPLWQHVPTRQGDQAVSDFLLYIPAFRRRGEHYPDYVAQMVLQVCRALDDKVIFANLDARLGLIWVSIPAEPGVCGRVAAALQVVLPEALLVGGQPAARPASGLLRGGSLRSGNLLPRLLNHIRRRAGRRLLPYRRDSAAR